MTDNIDCVILKHLKALRRLTGWNVTMPFVIVRGDAPPMAGGIVIQRIYIN